MSVIVTNKDMPQDCFDCFMREKCCGESCSIQHRKVDCPMKSVEGLIEEVNNMCDDADVFTLTTEFMNNRISMEDFIDAIGEFYRKEVAGIIKEYCEVSE